MHTIIRIAAVFALAVGSSGCKEYFNVDEACHPDGKFRGQGIDELNPSEVAAVDRMNCYRRLVGFERYGVDDTIQLAAENMGDYVRQNPDIFGRTGGNALSYLIQEGARPGFSGTEIWERLGATDYPIPDATAIRVEQGIGILPYEVGGVEMVDDVIMRLHWAQEAVLTPSPLDIGYAELPLDSAWWNATGLDESAWGPLPERGTFVYWVIAAQAPPTEGAGEDPVVYPKRNMEGVPLSGPVAYDRFLPDVNNDNMVNELDSTQLSYPITLGYTSSLNPGGSGGVTPFDLVITSATIDGPNGPLETIWTSPGETDPANHRLTAPLGGFNYWAGGIHATEPFQPNTAYRLYVDITTVDGPISHNITFTTAGSDAIGGANTAAGTTSRSVRGVGRDARPLDGRWFGRQTDWR